MCFDGHKRRKWKTATQSTTNKVKNFVAWQEGRTIQTRTQYIPLRLKCFTTGKTKNKKDQADTGTKTTMEQKGGTKEEEEGERSGMEDWGKWMDDGWWMMEDEGWMNDELWIEYMKKEWVLHKRETHNYY